VRPRYLLIVVPRGGMYEGLDAGGGPGAPTAGVGGAGVVDGQERGGRREHPAAGNVRGPHGGRLQIVPKDGGGREWVECSRCGARIVAPPERRDDGHGNDPVRTWRP
jgi:hypothetical protein